MAQVLHRRLDLGGVLAYTDRHFFQVIEGAVEHVAELMNLIRNDTRHHNMRVLCEQAVSTREYATWSTAAITSLDLTDTIAELGAGEGADCGRGSQVARLVLAEASPFLATDWGCPPDV